MPIICYGNFQKRVELIKGKILKMSPAPSRNHQEISWIITRQLDKIFRKTFCKMYKVPFDIRLVDFKNSSDDSQIVSVVQPSLCVVFDLSYFYTIFTPMVSTVGFLVIKGILK